MKYDKILGVEYVIKMLFICYHRTSTLCSVKLYQYSLDIAF